MTNTVTDGGAGYFLSRRLVTVRSGERYGVLRWHNIFWIFLHESVLCCGQSVGEKMSSISRNKIEGRWGICYLFLCPYWVNGYKYWSIWNKRHDLKRVIHPLPCQERCGLDGSDKACLSAEFPEQQYVCRPYSTWLPFTFCRDLYQ